MQFKHCEHCGDPLKIAHKEAGRVFCSADCFIKWLEGQDDKD